MADQFYVGDVYLLGSDVQGEVAELYEARAGVSIEDDTFYANFFLVKNGIQVKAGLGGAEYRVFDRDRNLVAGLSESGLSADGEGLYEITPVSASGLQDLNHYLIEVTISYGGQDRVGIIPMGIVE